MFCPLDETQNLGNNTRIRQNTIKCYQDDIPVMIIEESEQNDFWNRKDMSPIRRFCLFASILLCIVTIVIFLYVLPCDSSMVCPPIIESQSSISWDKTLQDVGKFIIIACILVYFQFFFSFKINVKIYIQLFIPHVIYIKYY